jgi:tRNA pseudouridine38-40 synthase
LKNAVPITEEFVNNLLARLQGVVKRFEGSHNFHNYSRGLRAKDATANRYIMKMDVEKVIYKDVNFLRFKLIGQSFVYHQIRKMIGMTI